jgi:hypothetical protein
MRRPPAALVPIAALALAASVIAPAIVRAQTAPPTAGVPAAARPAPPPATKLEAFTPAAETAITYGYDKLGNVGGVSAEARELRDTRGAVVVRGVTVDVYESQYRQERSFVDVDELPELLRGIDALLDVKQNPTAFQNFEVQYTTKGDLQLAAYNAYGQIRYFVRAGRVLRAMRPELNERDLRKLRGMFEAAQQKLAALDAPK